MSRRKKSKRIVNKAADPPPVATTSQRNSEKNSQDFVTNFGKVYSSLFDFSSSFIKSFKLELIVALIGVTLAYGQYIQNVTSIRINVTEIWREGYTDEIRNRVSKFRIFYKKWKLECKTDQTCLNEVNKTLKAIVDLNSIYFGEIKDDSNRYFIENDIYLRNLVCEDLKVNQKKEDSHKNKDKRSLVISQKKIQACNLQIEPSREDLIAEVLKYRNAIIESLNTAEAVKAVMEAKPYLKQDIVYKDTLPGRYRDIVFELKEDLMPFIHAYRDLHKKRETSAWFVLTNDESDENEKNLIRWIIWTFVLVILFVLISKLIYLLVARENSEEKK